MRKVVWTTVTLALLNSRLLAQEPVEPYPASSPEEVYGADPLGVPSPPTSEPLYPYDDLEVWKHGWLQINPYEHGYHSYRPYNYRHVLSQSAQSARWGMSPVMPYSQTYYLPHGPLTDIRGEPISVGNGLPVSRQAAPPTMRPAEGGISSSPLRTQPFDLKRSPGQFNRLPGLTTLPGHQFAPQKTQSPDPADAGISPINFQQLHQDPASGAEFERRQAQKSRMQQLLEQARPVLQGPRFR